MNEKNNFISPVTGDVTLVKGILTAFAILMQLQVYAHSVTLSASNSAPNSCSSRVITATVSGGSGSYTYFWTSEPASSVNLGNGPAITVSPGGTTTYTVAVHDNSNSTFATASVAVGKILLGSLCVSRPNSFTPNGDGINDTWKVLDGGGGNDQLNAYRYELTITNSSSQVVQQIGDHHWRNRRPDRWLHQLERETERHGKCRCWRFLSLLIEAI